VARVNILLITLILLAGMLGCDVNRESYTLTIASTAGGSVTTPGEGVFTYDEGTVVNLVAEAEGGYHFIKWTSNGSAIADVNTDVTTITMHDSYSITANFEEVDPSTLFAGGNGTEENPYQIANWSHLNNIRDYLNSRFILINNLKSTTAGYWELASSTANGGKGWQPTGTVDERFAGVFNGQEHEIKNLFINRPEEGPIGLFGSIGMMGAVIKNVGVVDADVTGGEASGSLVGYNELGTVDNCYATGSVTGDVEAMGMGGLVGINERGTVVNCYATSSVAGGWQFGVSIGGLVGLNEDGILSDCHATGSVTGDSSVGGLVGHNHADGTVSNCYAAGSVISDGEADGIGGLAGSNFGTVSDCYATGSVTGGWVRGEAIGGLVGDNHHLGSISNSYYNYDTVLINGEKIITVGSLCEPDFEEWLANGKFLDVNERLSEEDSYYVVNDVSDFKQLLAFGQNDTLKFRLASDLDLATEPNFYIPYLAGDFDGNNHKIFDLSLSFDFLSHVGLFGYLADGASVTRLGVESVSINGADYVGGVIGLSKGTVSNCHAGGSVTGKLYVGGLMGYNYHGTVSNSSSTANVVGDGINVSSLMGGNHEGAVSDCYSTGSVTGEDNVGGLIGWNIAGTVSNSYSTGSMTGDYHVGGLIGTNGGIVSNSYSAGSVTGEENVGGLVGDNLHTVSNSFWDTETSGQSTSDGGTGKTTAEMQDIATFSGAGWDIIEVADPDTRNPAYIWNIVDDETYPFLNWQP